MRFAFLSVKFGNIFLTAMNAVFPIVLLIALGYVLKRIKFLNKDFIKTGNKLVFKVLLPVMLFINVYDADFKSLKWDVILFSVVAIIAIFAIGLVVCVLTTKRNDRRGVILQCTFRSNFAIIGTSLAVALAGSSEIISKNISATVAIIQAFSIPLFNILAVISLSVFVSSKPHILTESALVADAGDKVLPTEERKSERNGIKRIIMGIITNPLIIGVAVGLIFLAVRELQIACAGSVVFSFSKHLKFLYKACSDLKLIASPLALIILGGQFEFSAVKGMLKEIIVGTSFRLVIAPLIGIGVAVLLSNYTNLFTFGAEEYPALLALFGSPVAVSSAIMAGEMKNDEQLATQLVVWTSICSVLTVFVTVLILMSSGLLAVE